MLGGLAVSETSLMHTGRWTSCSTKHIFQQSREKWSWRYKCVDWHTSRQSWEGQNAVSSMTLCNQCSIYKNFDLMCTCSPLVSLRKMTGIEYSRMNAPLYTCILQSVVFCNLPLSISDELWSQWDCRGLRLLLCRLLWVAPDQLLATICLLPHVWFVSYFILVVDCFLLNPLDRVCNSKIYGLPLLIIILWFTGYLICKSCQNLDSYKQIL